MVLSAGPTEVRQIVEDAAARHSLNVKVAFEVRSIQAMKALVLRGVGVTVLPYGSVKEELLSRRLTGSRIAEPGLNEVQLPRLASRFMTDKTCH